MVRIVFVPDNVLVLAHFQAKTDHVLFQANTSRVLFKIYAALIRRFDLLDRGFCEYCIHGRIVVVVGWYEETRPPRDSTSSVVS